ncbi:flagellar biosynthetic protein FliR [Planctomicrobium sp. SH664]|uniref:flagellar biosynthetic protein FliR n=1 Tax=Planctomicrobium sp. SH664 TaxID=3448125 RepID=UPI003F5B56B5
MTTSFAVMLLLTFLRISGFVTFLPPFGGKNIPSTVKIGLICSLTAMWSMKLTPSALLTLQEQTTGHWGFVVWLCARETFLGAAMGWLLGLILVPVRVAGAYIVQEMGLTLGAITSPTEGTESNVLSQAFEVAAVLAIFGMNLHHQFLRLFDAAFTAFPLGKSWTFPQRDWLLGSLTHSTEIGLGIAAPVGIVLFATLVTTLFVMRQTPQFNLMSFGMPVRILVGLVATLWLLPGILNSLYDSLQHFASFSGL